MIQFKSNGATPPIDMVANPSIEKGFTIWVIVVFLVFLDFAVNYFINILKLRI
ncbi:hypothetical protein HZF24_06500 [Sedimentibacter hydroxybenzoicus DSM 7310]|uniref:Uncharacterized protein n=1 Tax=Sedimentibacter hydroxybenzoicus DSM 7310 TaxID=1123245 RepID=A0A974BJH2_SEDHY|nr:hypothetical protein [Sedimentibacter hydroxybenzoicus]NYB73790.1 hypothetical protein [Sedimentibacter hydroxybenzoicus DSM 7310]